jgi:hypothetical protein
MLRFTFTNLVIVARVVDLDARSRVLQGLQINVQRRRLPLLFGLLLLRLLMR